MKTSHGIISVPVPVVLELARRHDISLSGTKDYNLGELTTPTGLALLIAFADNFIYPEYFA